jgi:hypothetical protein
MRASKRITIATVTIAAAVMISACPSPVHASDVPGPCYLTARTGETVKHRMKRIIRCGADRWSVPGGATKAICIANRESHLNPHASSATGKYLGLFQHSAAAWPGRYKAWTRPRWELHPNALNGRTNAIVTIRMVHAGGWGPWKGVGC